MLVSSGFFTAAFLIALVAFPLPMAAGVLSIAHRGDSLFAPENTMAAFDSALGKSDLVETDVHVSSDGRLVILHDSTVDRTTDGSGAVSGKTLAQLKLLDAGSWFASNFVGERIPTLEEMITRVLPGAVPLIERKAGSAAAFVAELQRLNVVTNVVLQSFDWNFLAAVHALDPAIPLCALGSGTLNSAVLSSVTNAGARTVAWEKSDVSSNEVSLVHGMGLKLFVWTVDGAQIQNFIDLGVDGIISNDPGMVKQLQGTTTNSPANLSEGLLTYWKMDDGLADPFTTTLIDSRGANPGTLVRNDGASHWFDASVSKFGGCLKLEGTNAFVVIPPSATLDINTNALTFSAWVRLLNLPSQLATSFGAIFDSTTDCYVLYLDRANKELRFKITDTAGHAARPGIPEIHLRTNEWLHVAATFSGQAGPASGQATIYLNGQPRDVHTGNDGTSPFGLRESVKTGQSAAMGREGPAGASYFTGFVDDVAIWRRALSASEIQALFQGSLGGQSLEDLIREPTPLIGFFSIQKNSQSGQLEIGFENLGPWQEFRLLRASQANGPFLVVPGVAPGSLGNAKYRFSYPLGTNESEYFRIEGR